MSLLVLAARCRGLLADFKKGQCVSTEIPLLGTNESKQRFFSTKSRGNRGAGQLSASRSGKQASASLELPAEIQLLKKRRQVVQGLIVIIADSAANAFEIARVLKVKNSGDFSQGWLGDLSFLNTASSSSNARVIITWTLGNMFSLVGDDLKQRSWSTRGVVPATLSELPWIPSRLRVASRAGDANNRQLQILHALLLSASEIINAVEPDAAGETLFRDLLQYVNLSDRKFKRAWIKSRTDSDIIEAFSNLVDGRALDPLATYIACARAVDQLVGVNYTAMLSHCASSRPAIRVGNNGEVTIVAAGRAAFGDVPSTSSLNSKLAEELPTPDPIEDAVGDTPDSFHLPHSGPASDIVEESFHEDLPIRSVIRKSHPSTYQEAPYNVGRLQLPILRLIVERYIRNYQELAHRSISPKFGIVLRPKTSQISSSVTIPWVWCGRDSDIGSHSHSHDIDRQANPHNSPFGCESEDELREVLRELQTELRIVSSSSRTIHEETPRLFNMTELQKEAALRFNLSAHATSVIAMELFNARVISYPKTVSRTIPVHQTRELLNCIIVWSKASRYRALAETVAPRARAAIARREPHIFTSETSVAEHHAIIPVLPSQKADAKVIDAFVSKLNDMQKKVLDLIVLRLFEATFPESTREETELVAVNNNRHYFVAHTSFVLNNGWHQVRAIREAALSPRLGPGRPFKQGTSSSKTCLENPVVPNATLEPTPVSAPVSLKVGDIITFPDLIDKVSTIINLSVQPQKPKHELVTDSELISLLDDPIAGSSGLGISDISMRDTAIQQLVHWKYVQHKDGAYIPTRRAIRLVKLLSDERISTLEALWNQEVQLRSAAVGKVSADDVLKELKSNLSSAVGPLASRGQLFLPYDLDSFHANKGTWTFEMKSIESDHCPKCRTRSSLVIGINAVFCTHAACNFTMLTTFPLNSPADSPSGEGAQGLPTDLTVEFTLVQKIQLIRGQKVVVEPKRFNSFDEINVEIQVPSLLPSIITPRPVTIGNNNAPSLKPRVRSVRAYLDPSSRFELVLEDITNPAVPKPLLPRPGTPPFPHSAAITATPASAPIAELQTKMFQTIRTAATSTTSLWDEWVGDAEFTVPSFAPSQHKTEKARSDQGKKREGRSGDLVPDPALKLKMQIERLRQQKQNAAGSIKSK